MGCGSTPARGEAPSGTGGTAEQQVSILVLGRILLLVLSAARRVRALRLADLKCVKDGWIQILNQFLEISM